MMMYFTDEKYFYFKYLAATTPALLFQIIASPVAKVYALGLNALRRYPWNWSRVGVWIFFGI